MAPARLTIALVLLLALPAAAQDATFVARLQATAEGARDALHLLWSHALLGSPAADEPTSPASWAAEMRASLALTEARLDELTAEGRALGESVASADLYDPARLADRRRRLAALQADLPATVERIAALRGPPLNRAVADFMERFYALSNELYEPCMR